MAPMTTEAESRATSNCHHCWTDLFSELEACLSLMASQQGVYRATHSSFNKISVCSTQSQSINHPLPQAEDINTTLKKYLSIICHCSLPRDHALLMG